MMERDGQTQPDTDKHDTHRRDRQRGGNLSFTQKRQGVRAECTKISQLGAPMRFAKAPQLERGAQSVGLVFCALTLRAGAATYA